MSQIHSQLVRQLSAQRSTLSVQRLDQKAHATPSTLATPTDTERANTNPSEKLASNPAIKPRPSDLTERFGHTKTGQMPQQNSTDTSAGLHCHEQPLPDLTQYQTNAAQPGDITVLEQHRQSAISQYEAVPEQLSAIRGALYRTIVYLDQQIAQLKSIHPNTKHPEQEPNTAN